MFRSRAVRKSERHIKSEYPTDRSTGGLKCFLTFKTFLFLYEVVILDILNIVGNTPLLELKKLLPNNENIHILGRVEFLNISGSVKDRAAKAMIFDGIKSGSLTKDKTIIDATNGNTGISYAMIGAALGYKVKLCMPSNVTEDRKKIMGSYGAEIIETDLLESIDRAYYECRTIVADDPEEYFYPDQYANDQNWQSHYFGTAEEIIRQTNGIITHFVAGTGTSGTFMGCTKKLKEFNHKIKCFTMTPDSPFHGIEGIKHRSALLDKGFFDESIADGVIEISTEIAYKTAGRLAREEGLFVGISSGANVAEALKIAENAPQDSVIITVLCDGGYRYLLDSLWSDLS